MELLVVFNKMDCKYKSSFWNNKELPLCSLYLELII